MTTRRILPPPGEDRSDPRVALIRVARLALAAQRGSLKLRLTPLMASTRNVRSVTSGRTMVFGQRIWKLPRDRRVPSTRFPAKVEVER
jgi:hypothetical protein